ncbi:MAG: hypothetical protein KJP21_08935, partial [Bacteroidia bacterium]|nr:hypothetical protein [Bacteroidia bacterium]
MRFFILALFLFVITSVFGQATLPVKDTFLTRNSLPTGYSHTGLGTDYSGPKLNFDNTGDSLIIFINAAPGPLTFSLGTNDTFTLDTLSSTTVFQVLQSVNGTTYDTVATIGDGTSFIRGEKYIN